MIMIYSGRCLCENIQFEIEAKDPLPFGHCHCSACRKSHGADFTSATIVKESHLRIGKGQDFLTTFRSSSHMERQFCSCCGSRLFVRFSRQEKDSGASQIVYSVAINSLDRIDKWRETGHIFVGDKAPWHERADDKPMP
jgi:hypothetical protein